MAGRRLLLILSLVLALRTTAGTQSLPLIVQMASGITDSIAAGAANIDSKNPGYENQLGHGRIDVLHTVKPN